MFGARRVENRAFHQPLLNAELAPVRAGDDVVAEQRRIVKVEPGRERAAKRIGPQSLAVGLDAHLTLDLRQQLLLHEPVEGWDDIARHQTVLRRRCEIRRAHRGHRRAEGNLAADADDDVLGKIRVGGSLHIARQRDGGVEGVVTVQHEERWIGAVRGPVARRIPDLDAVGAAGGLRGEIEPVDVTVPLEGRGGRRRFGRGRRRAGDGEPGGKDGQNHDLENGALHSVKSPRCVLTARSTRP